jgi:tetratricopeptide (TPR) repeat protein
LTVEGSSACDSLSGSDRQYPHLTFSHALGTINSPPAALAATQSADLDDILMNPGQNPSEAERLCDEGYSFLEAGQFNEAAANLQRALALAPTNPLIHYRLGLLLSDTGRPAEAVKALDVVLSLQPDNARAHNNRGSALQLLGRIDEAEQSFRRALQLAPDLELPYVNLGKLLEQRGKLDQAMEMYNRALTNGLDAAVFRHYLAAASGQVTSRAPASWVRDTFDNFAPLFDNRLRDLQYDAPRRLAGLVRSRRRPLRYPGSGLRHRSVRNCARIAQAPARGH